MLGVFGMQFVLDIAKNPVERFQTDFSMALCLRQRTTSTDEAICWTEDIAFVVMLILMRPVSFFQLVVKIQMELRSISRETRLGDWLRREGSGSIIAQPSINRA